MDRFFLIRYCTDKCEFPEHEYCFAVSQKSVLRCTKCVAKELTKTWACDSCQRKFNGFDEYFELPVPPPIVFPPGQKMVTVPAMVYIKKLCKSCYEQVGLS